MLVEDFGQVLNAEDAPITGVEYLDDVLQDGRRGYCAKEPLPGPLGCLPSSPMHIGIYTNVHGDAVLPLNLTRG